MGGFDSSRGARFKDQESLNVFVSFSLPGTVFLSFANPPESTAESPLQANEKADRGWGIWASFEYSYWVQLLEENSYTHRSLKKRMSCACVNIWLR